MPKIAVAMSGGVDSSVTALLLKEQGHDVIGVTFMLTDISDAPQVDSKNVCDFLGIQHKIVDYRQDFNNKVVIPFINSYLNAQTPNPCILCNKAIKFGEFLKDALQMGCEQIATGHYCNIAKVGDKFCLKKADDISKDQSYALYKLGQSELSKIIFPISQMTKTQLRALAKEKGLPVANRPDSQDICFIPDGNHGRFIEDYIGNKKLNGNFVDEHGKILGKHNGIYNYTIGQRKGLGISLGKYAFIKSIDKDSKDIVITTDESEIFSTSLIVTNPIFSIIAPPTTPIDVQVKIRYSHKPCNAKIIMQGDDVKVMFETPQRAVTSGQGAVFYVDNFLVGGGTISAIAKSQLQSEQA